VKQILLTTMVLAAACLAHADTTDEIMFQSGTFTATLTDGEVTFADPGTCTGNACSDFQYQTISGKHIYDQDPADGTIKASAPSKANLFNGWLITVTTGNSNSPSLDPYGLETDIIATCETSACVGATEALNITYSDQNFTTLASSLEAAYSGVITGDGSTTALAYSSGTNALFAKTTLIGEVGPFSSSSSVGMPFGGTASGGPSPSSPYSLTLTDNLDATAKGASFSTDLDITGFAPSPVPEPGAVVLFGTVLVFFTARLRALLVR
jgi:hypothetical protein